MVGATRASRGGTAVSSAAVGVSLSYVAFNYFPSGIREELEVETRVWRWWFGNRHSKVSSQRGTEGWRSSLRAPSKVGAGEKSHL